MDDAAASTGKALRVLVVDDDPLARQVLLALLARIGHRADVASSGAAAIQAVKSGTYDVILMDLLMPEMGGLEAAQRILGGPAAPRPRIIAMTASAFEEDHVACREAGMVGVLLKPVRVEALRSALGA